MNRLKLSSMALATLALVFASSASHAIVVDVARFGTASQSTTRNGNATQGDIAQVAVDGNTDGVFNNGSVTHTNNVPNTFWELNLNADRAIDTIQLFNRADCCGNRLGNYRLSIFDGATEVFGQDNAGSVAQGGNIAVNTGGVTGDRVRVQLNGLNNEGNGTMSLAEVRVFANIAENDADFFGNGRNLARFGDASQSSTRTGTAGPHGANKAILAIDGNTDGNFGAGSVTHTASATEQNTFWEVDLKDTFHIDNVRLFNRDALPNRLSNYNIDIFDENHVLVGSIDNPGGPGTGYHAVAPGTQGRFLRVQLDPQSNEGNGPGVLSLAEVQIFGGELENIARNGFASQSNTGFGGLASRAIDGITDGNYGSASVSHTANGTNATFDLDFGGSFGVEELVIFNRTDCCSERLSGAEISVFNGMGEVFATTLGNMAGVPMVRIDLGGNFAATSLQIRAANGNFLSLAEVQVFATQVPEPASFALLGLSGLFLARRRRNAA